MFFSYANSEDPDETPHYVASHLGVRCLTMSHLWDARLIMVKNRSNSGGHFCLKKQTGNQNSCSSL